MRFTSPERGQLRDLGFHVGQMLTRDARDYHGPLIGPVVLLTPGEILRVMVTGSSASGVVVAGGRCASGRARA